MLSKFSASVREEGDLQICSSGLFAVPLAHAWDNK